MKIAFTGAEGMLGHALQLAFSDLNPLCFTEESLDVTNLDHVMTRLREIRPDYLIHAAAFTNVDQCEAEPDKAYLVNGLGSRNIAMACEEIRCPVVYISTDYVFDGRKTAPYDEWDSTNPISVYGRSKLMGETFVSTLTNRYYIVRTSWLYGRKGRNFVDTILGLLAQRDRIEVVNDQTGSPTYSMDLARTIRALLGRGYGTYHITNSGSCSWYDFACAIAQIRGINKEIVPVTSEQFVRPAPRPRYSILDHTMLRLEGIGIPRHWRKALEEYLGS